MKKAFTWILLMSKRQLKHTATWAILLCMLLTIIAMKFMPSTITASIPIGYMIDADNKWYDSLRNSLDNHQGSLNFIAYTDKSVLEKDAVSGTIQAGYVFGIDLSLVDTYRSADSTASLLSDVVILAIVMEHSASDMLVKDILKQSFAKHLTDEDIESIKATYHMYATNGSTFSFDYNTLYDDYQGSSNDLDISSYIVTPVRGIIAIFIFVAALAAGAGCYTDANNQIYANIPPRRHFLLRLLNISIPAVLSGIVGLIGILIVGIHTIILYEVFALLAYTIICICFSFLLTYIVRQNLYNSLLPVFILGSVVCCPIFFNLGNLIPAMKIIQHVFLPTYYLTIFF